MCVCVCVWLRLESCYIDLHLVAYRLLLIAPTYLEVHRVMNCVIQRSVLTFQSFIKDSFVFRSLVHTAHSRYYTLWAIQIYDLLTYLFMAGIPTSFRSDFTSRSGQLGLDNCLLYVPS